MKIYKKLERIYDDYFLDGELFYYAASLSFYMLFALIPILLIIFNMLLYIPSFYEYLSSLKSVVLSYIVPSSLSSLKGIIDSYLKGANELSLLSIGYVLFTAVMFIRNFDFITYKMLGYSPHSLLVSVLRSIGMIALIPIIIAIIIFFSELKGLLLDDFIETPHIAWFMRYVTTCLLFFMGFFITTMSLKGVHHTLLASFITASVWSIFKLLFVYYIKYNHTYTTLYGGIGILMMFMLWIYISWFIILSGLRLLYFLSLRRDKD